MAPLEQFILFGDSITQGSNDQSSGFALASELQAVYIRRLDIINRGYSGYNTDHALDVIEHTIPTVAQASVRFLVIWFGANDCNREPTSGQYVPLERFKQNLIAIISHPLVKAQSPKIILLTNPPVEETIIGDLLREMGSTNETRKAKDAADYASTVREVGKETKTPVLDVWAAFMEKTGWKLGDAVLPGSKESGKDLILSDLLYDGLHLSANGYRLVFDALVKLIIETWPEQNASKMPYSTKLPWELALGSSFWDVYQS